MVMAFQAGNVSCSMPPVESTEKLATRNENSAWKTGALDNKQKSGEIGR